MKKRKPGQSYMIPAKFYNMEEWVPVDHPTMRDALYYSDKVLAEDLQCSLITLKKWKKENLIPYRQLRGGVPEYKLMDVVKALLEAGYPQENPDIIQKY